MQKWEYLEAEFYRKLGHEVKEAGITTVSVPVLKVSGSQPETSEINMEIHEWLNQQGKEGWELVSTFERTGTSGQKLYLKRPMS